MFNCVPFAVPPIQIPNECILGRREALLRTVISESEAVAASSAAKPATENPSLGLALAYKIKHCGGRGICKLRAGGRGRGGLQCSTEKMRHFSWDGVPLCQGRERGGISWSRCKRGRVRSAVLSCINAERGGKLGRHGGERASGRTRGKTMAQHSHRGHEMNILHNLQQYCMHIIHNNYNIA